MNNARNNKSGAFLLNDCNRVYGIGICLIVTVILLFSALSWGDEENLNSSREQSQYVTIDFNDVDINLFIKYISELTKKNFIVDRAVKGNVTIISPSKISIKDAYYVFESVLEVNGFTTIPSGAVTKIVPSVQARSKNIATIRQEGDLYPEDKVVTQLIQLTHSSPDDVKKILAPLVSKNSVVIAHTESGMLILTDVLSNLKRLEEIIKAVDIPSVGEELVLLSLEHASATDLTKSLNQLFLRTARKGGSDEIVKIIPYERTNSLIVFASRVNIQKISDLVAQLDVNVPRGEGRINVYYLQHANADELIKVLTNLPDSKNKDAAKGKAPVVSQDVRVMADLETNSLVIVAPRDEYAVLKEVIAKLDIPRRMVYIEALIMEVKVDKSFELGVQWGGGGTFDDGTGRSFTGFSGNPTSPYDAIVGLGQETPVFPAGFAMGVMKEGIKIGNMFFPNISAVLKAYKDDSDVNIIATPQILTTDNKKAEIKVGENVPYITSKNTTDAQQDYTNYEYKDVSTSLEITPQINQKDLVRLEIFTEIIKLKDPNSISQTPTTLKRAAKTTVVIHDRETVVIGGIIGQDTTTGEYKVPLFGDIPLLGWLFKTRTEYEQRTNLFIFITPHIVENPAEIASLYYQKRDLIDNVREGKDKVVDWRSQLKLTPDHAIALSDLGFAQLQNKNFEKAKQYFAEALRIDPDNPHALTNMGVVLEEEGNQEQAIEMYRKVLSLEAKVSEKQKGEIEEPKLRVWDIARDNLQQLGVPEQDDNVMEKSQ